MPATSAMLLMAAGICLATAVLVAFRRDSAGAVPLLALLVAVAEWNVGYALEIAASTLEAKVFWAKVQYLGITATPVAVAVFAARHTGREGWSTGGRLACAAAIPAASALLAFTNEAHRLVWTDLGTRTASGEPLQLGHGAAFYVFWVWSYVLLTAATGMLLTGGASTRRLLRRQSAAMLLAVLAPWAGNMAYVLELAPRHFDLTTIGFAVTATALAFACLRWRLLDVAPLARAVVVEHMREGMAVIDARGRVADCNPALAGVLRCTPDEAIGRPAGQVLPPEACRLVTGMCGSEPLPVIEIAGTTGARCYEVQAVVLPGREGHGGRVLLFHDVTARERAQANLTVQARTDELTGVGNRRSFLEDLRRALARAERDRRLIAVLYVDLDGFKAINDSLGHQAGDQVLRAAAERLQRCVRPGDAVARLGGDEFAVLLPAVEDAASANTVAERIAAAMAEPHPIASGGRIVPASVGLHVRRADPGACPEEFLDAADRGMYRDKRARGASVRAAA